MAEKRTTYKIQDLGGIGEVHIADEVVAIVAGLAATDVDGVASMAGNITNELVSKLGRESVQGRESDHSGRSRYRGSVTEYRVWQKHS